MPVSSYSKGAQKAYKSMQKQYGAKKGRSVFYALANKRAGKGRKGRSMAGPVSTAYKKGAHFKTSSRKTATGAGGRRTGNRVRGRMRLRG